MMGMAWLEPQGWLEENFLLLPVAHAVEQRFMGSSLMLTWSLTGHDQFQRAVWFLGGNTHRHAAIGGVGVAVRKCHGVCSSWR